VRNEKENKMDESDEKIKKQKTINKRKTDLHCGTHVALCKNGKE